VEVEGQELTEGASHTPPSSLKDGTMEIVEASLTEEAVEIKDTCYPSRREALFPA
jgi:hypothetical protein